MCIHTVSVITQFTGLYCMIIRVDSILHLKIIRFISLLYCNDPESRKEDPLITPRSCDMVLGDNTKKV